MATRAQFYDYLLTVFQLTPTPATRSSVTDLCAQCRARTPGSTARLLATVAPLLGTLVEDLEIEPGEIVDLLWEVVREGASDTVQIRSAIRTLVRTSRRGERFRRDREKEFTSLLPSEEFPSEGLPPWLSKMGLSPEQLRILVGYALLEETASDLAKALEINLNTANQRRIELFRKLKEFFNKKDR